MSDLFGSLVAQKDKYADDFYQLAQQDKSILSNTVDAVSIDAKRCVYDRIGTVKFNNIISQYQDTQYQEVEYSRRVLESIDKSYSTMIDSRDTSRAQLSPQGDILQNTIAAFNREKDKAIYDAAIGKTTSLNSDNTTAQVALPAGQVLSAGSSNMTVDKIIDAITIFGDNDVDIISEGGVLVLSSKQYQSLAKQEKFINGDFTRLTDGESLKAGIFGRFMGIPLVRISNDLMKKTGNIRSCVMYTKKAIKYGELAGFNEVSIDKIPTKHNNIQLMHKISLGATRMDEKRVVEIKCDETA
jgi:hypothetical protein